VLARIVAWVDRLQRRRALLGFPIAVGKKFGEDRATSLCRRKCSIRRSPGSR
jgi:hypothetical protein